VLAGLLIVLLVEAAHQFLEDRAHRVVVEAILLHRSIGIEDWIRAEVDRRIEELDDERSERIRLREARNLIPEFKVLENYLDVGREPVEIGFEVRLQ
jgi:hypothetical protein